MLSVTASVVCKSVAKIRRHLNCLFQNTASFFFFFSWDVFLNLVAVGNNRRQTPDVAVGTRPNLLTVSAGRGDIVFLLHHITCFYLPEIWACLMGLRWEMSPISDRRRSAIGSGPVTGSSFQAASPCSTTFRIRRSEDARSVNWIVCLALQSSYIFVVSRKACACVRASAYCARFFTRLCTERQRHLLRRECPKLLHRACWCGDIVASIHYCSPEEGGGG